MNPTPDDFRILRALYNGAVLIGHRLRTHIGEVRLTGYRVHKLADMGYLKLRRGAPHQLTATAKAVLQFKAARP